MFLESMLTIYSWLTTLILVGIGYFIKRKLDLKSRKLEINHTLWQENKINALNQFSEEISKTITMWNSFSIYKLIENKVSVEELDETISTRLSSLQKNILILSLYFKEPTFSSFQSIFDNFCELSGVLRDIFTGFTPTHEPRELRAYYFKQKSAIERKNDDLLNTIRVAISSEFQN